MRTQSLRAVRHFTHVYLHAKTADWVTVILIMRKFEDSQFEPHARIKMAQVLGSPVHIYASCSQ